MPNYAELCRTIPIYFPSSPRVNSAQSQHPTIWARSDGIFKEMREELIRRNDLSAERTLTIKARRPQLFELHQHRPPYTFSSSMSSTRGISDGMTSLLTVFGGAASAGFSVAGRYVTRARMMKIMERALADCNMIRVYRDNSTLSYIQHFLLPSHSSSSQIRHVRSIRDPKMIGAGTDPDKDEREIINH